MDFVTFLLFPMLCLLCLWLLKFIFMFTPKFGLHFRDLHLLNKFMIYSHEIKRRLLLGRKAMTNLDSIWKSRDNTLPTKVHIDKAMVFPGVMDGCELDHKEGWALKEIDVFKLWCWRRLLRVPWTARRSSQSILREINPEYSLEGLMLKL